MKAPLSQTEHRTFDAPPSPATFNVRFAVQPKRGERPVSRLFSQPKGQIVFTHSGIWREMLIGFTLARSLNEPARSKSAVRSLEFSGVLACAVLGSSRYVVTEIREAIHQP
ncbi:hypothetical protein [Pseudomonas sp. NPDC088444]|uniref:hypothetical protein n=1 Tax=Pseudomonas sp. NPDC088444 TaxID=3364456 RepID=UPI00384C8DCA